MLALHEAAGVKLEMPSRSKGKSTPFIQECETARP